MPRTGLAFAATWAASLLCTTGLALAATVSPLPEADYTTRSVCSKPVPGHAGCLAIELVGRTPAARAHTHPLGMRSSRAIAAASPGEGAYGLRPQDLHDAYFPGKTELPDAPASTPQTIALVDAYNDPKAEVDLASYDQAFGLPSLHACGANEGACFEQVGQDGTTELPFPKSETEREAREAVCLSARAKESRRELEEREEACVEVEEAEGWAVEISTDVEMAHAVCQNCRILLVEASTSSFGDLEAAEETAVRLGATEVSDSWGGEKPTVDSAAFDHPATTSHPGVVVTAAAGDEGYLNWTAAAQAATEKEAYYSGADYPASSPEVVAVGGTKLTMSGGARESETVWNEDPDPEGGNQGAGGSGCSEAFGAPSWQRAVPDWSEVGCGSKRAVADVSADADPYTGVAVYDSVPSVHEEGGKVVNTPIGWWPIGGTSVASPIIASMFALAGGDPALSGGSHKGEYAVEALYSHLGSSSLYDVTEGSSGACDGSYAGCDGSLSSPLDCGAGAWICNAVIGYDGPTGVGTPNGIDAFESGEAPAKGDQEGEPKTSPPEEADRSPGTGLEAGGSAGSESSGAQTLGSSSSGSTSGGPSGTSSGSPTRSGSATTIKAGARISALALTANARTALRHGRLAIAQVAFSLRASQAVILRVTLTVQVGAGRHAHWRALSGSLSFAAIKGLNRRRLRGAGTLAPGLYRLSFVPAGGTSRAIVFRLS
jgi:hypothetical protein